MQDELGQNVYAFGWREYDPAIGRFTKVDRFAEKYHRHSPYGYTSNNPVYFMEIRGDSINVAKIKQFDSINNTNHLQNIINDLDSQTGLTFITNSNGQLIYQTDANGNPVISTTTDEKGNVTQNGSAEARKIMTNAVSTTNQAFVRIDLNGNSGTSGIGSPLINLNPNQINSFITGANNVNNRTLGWGMTLMHEILHSNVAEGGAIGHGDEKINFGNTGSVVDRINTVRSELNTLGGNYGIRQSYQAIYFNSQTQSPMFLPFDSSSLNSLINGNTPASNTMYLQIK